ncbi:MAG: methyltransferase domain-containing protein [Ruminococcaceae bacterium]|nr:methyltransferase domain-containing protein [Oscillospiraceae bacterium]
MNQSLIDLLCCPVCKSGMRISEDGKTCRCMGSRIHSYDFSKSGYLNLGGPHAGDGDSKEAILARREFLDAGHYEPLSREINKKLDEIGAKTVLDAGCGEGYYTNRMAQSGRRVLGFDLSRAGVDYAARRAKQTEIPAGFAVASIFSIPVLDSTADVVTNIFAPCSEAEFGRVLKSNGYVLLVGAGESHLIGLKQALYETVYQNRSREDMPQNMHQVSYKRLTYEIQIIGQAQIQALFSMTPYYWRTSPHDRSKLVGMERLTTTVDFDLFLFRKDS